MDAIATAAAQWRDAGVPLVMLHPILPNGRCGCGDPDCANAGKHPFEQGWQTSPRLDDEQFETSVMVGDFDSGYGVRLDNLLVIDGDARHGFDPEKLPGDMACGYVVQTGSGGNSRHYFYRWEGDRPQKHHPELVGVDILHGKSFVVGAGSHHRSGGRYKVLTGSVADIGDPPAWLVEMITSPQQTLTVSTSTNPSAISGSGDLAEIASALGAIPNGAGVEWDEYKKVMLAVHHATAGSDAGFDLFDQWAQRSPKYTGRSINKQWRGIKDKSGNVLTKNSLFWLAQQHGWEAPICYGDCEVVLPPDEESADLPFAIDDINLLHPPGFVGEVVRWIDRQCVYPRQRLAVLAGIVAVSNLVGLRCAGDDAYQTRTNLIAFATAGSGSGKEAVLQAINKIYDVGGIRAAVYGSIKSTQEMYRNLIAHQASIYNVDEVGYLFGKIISAAKRGGAAYLDEVISTIMAVSTKANGIVDLTGDVKRQLKHDITSKLKSLDDAIANNEVKGNPETARANLLAALESADKGLANPFLSLLGCATPMSMEPVLTREQLLNGFLARALLVQEPETNPKSRGRSFRPEPMPPFMAAQIAQLRWPAGTVPEDDGDVRYSGEVERIPYSAEAEALMEQFEEWQYHAAEREKEGSGYVPLIRRMGEQIAKVALVLGAPGGLIEGVHVRWATAWVHAMTVEKVRIASASDETQDPAVRLQHRIMAMCDAEGGQGIGNIANGCRGHGKKDDVVEMVERMVDAGLLRVEIRKPAGRGRPSKRFLIVR
jgi:hypothetical protein